MNLMSATDRHSKFPGVYPGSNLKRVYAESSDQEVHVPIALKRERGAFGCESLIGLFIIKYPDITGSDVSTVLRIVPRRTWRRRRLTIVL